MALQIFTVFMHIMQAAVIPGEYQKGQDQGAVTSKQQVASAKLQEISAAAETLTESQLLQLGLPVLRSVQLDFMHCLPAQTLQSVTCSHISLSADGLNMSKPANTLRNMQQLQHNALHSTSQLSPAACLAPRSSYLCRILTSTAHAACDITQACIHVRTCEDSERRLAEDGQAQG